MKWEKIIVHESNIWSRENKDFMPNLWIFFCCWKYWVFNTHGENGESLKEIDNSVYSKYW